MAARIATLRVTGVNGFVERSFPLGGNLDRKLVLGFGRAADTVPMTSSHR